MNNLKINFIYIPKISLKYVTVPSDFGSKIDGLLICHFKFMKNKYRKILFSYMFNYHPKKTSHYIMKIISLLWDPENTENYLWSAVSLKILMIELHNPCVLMFVNKLVSKNSVLYKKKNLNGILIS